MDDDPSVMRNVRLISWLCALAPVLTILSFASMAVYAWLGLDSWTEDPALGRSVWHLHTVGVLLWCLVAALAMPPVWLAAVIVGWREPKMLPTFATQVAVWIAGAALFYAFAHWNPDGVMEWFFV